MMRRRSERLGSIERVTAPALNSDQIHHIILLCELRAPRRLGQSYKTIAREVGCTPLQVRWQWRRYLQFRAKQKHAAINLKREIEDAKANPASEPYLGGHWKTW